MEIKTEISDKNDLILEPLSLTNDEIEKTHSLLKLVWPSAGHITPEYLTWQYINNPLGKAYGYNAIDNNKIIGHYVAIPIEANIFGKKESGLLSLNTAVHPDYRGRQLFKKLAQVTFDKAKKDGKTFIVWSSKSK